MLASTNMVMVNAFILPYTLYRKNMNTVCCVWFIYALGSYKML